MSVSVRTEETVVVKIELSEDVAARLEAVLSLVRFYDYPGDTPKEEALNALYANLHGDYEAKIVNGLIEVEKQ